MKYHDITKDDMLNGDGLRVVLWVSGCSHKCKNCQNPITWDPDYGVEFGDGELKEIYDQLDKDYISGITFSGGDPLFCSNREFITDLAKKIKEKYPDKTIWCYTGYEWNDVKDLEVMQYVDVLVDGRFIEEKKDTKLMWKGSKNQRVIDVQKSLGASDIVLHCQDYGEDPTNTTPCKGCDDDEPSLSNTRSND